MKSTLNQAKKMFTKIENQLEYRKNIFFSRSENWQNSQRGIDFKEKSYELVSTVDDLNRVIDSLENFVKM